MVIRALKAFLQILHVEKGKAWWKRNMQDPNPLFKRYHELGDAERRSLEEWLERVSELKAAYWVKEDFCNLYELPSSKAADEQYNEWAARAKETSPAFNSVIHTVKIWRPHVFKYNDYKDRFSLKVTNGFAEAANNQIKRLRRLCSGMGFWVLRARLLFGAGFVRYRPAHPLDAERTSARSSASKDGTIRAKSRKKCPSPNAHSERLRRAYEERDQTKGLLPHPRDNEKWRKRFESSTSLQLPPPAHEQLVLFQ
jgi:hypothetical protein